MKVLILILFVINLASVSSFGQESCQGIFNDNSARIEALKNDLRKILPSMMWYLSRIPPEVMSGEKTPTWENFNNLSSALEFMKSARTTLSPDVLLEFKALAAELKVELMGQHEFLQNFQAIPKAKSTEKQYLPTEYELKLAFQFLIGKINKELPRDLRLPITRIPFDRRRFEINKKAREIMNEIHKPGFEKLFSTTGHSDYATFEATLRSSTDPLIQKAVELIDKDLIQPVIRRPESGRFWIPKTGFQNQFSTGSSRGILNPQWRNHAENKMLNLNKIEEYRLLDAELKPKYGTMRAAPESGLSFTLAPSSDYGPDIYVLKIKNVQDRLNLTASDSLGYGMRSGIAKHWLENFIPWDRRLLMVPLMIKSLMENTFSAGRTPPSTSIQIKMLENEILRENYWEVQILGALSLKDVHSFEFTSMPPRGEFLTELRRHNIKIFDGRSQPAVEWAGE